jgi:hypothetical protein
MRVGVMVGSRFGQDKPERSVRGKAEKVKVVKKAVARKKAAPERSIAKRKETLA